MMRNAIKSVFFILLIILLALVGLVLVFFMPKRVKTPVVMDHATDVLLPKPAPADIPKEQTISGQYNCLPSKNTNGPITLECALGIQALSGEYYALDMSAVSVDASSIRTQQKITVKGLVVPIEQISSNHWAKYDIKGIIKVETFIKN